MGLDMYLKRKIWIGANFEYQGITGNIDIYKGDIKYPIKFNKVTNIEQEGIYWRKANEIHKWFVDTIQEGKDDCGEYWVSIDKIEELQGLCKMIIDTTSVNGEKIKNEELSNSEILDKIWECNKLDFDRNLAETILPTQEGFFFGSYEYDKYYIWDIVYTYIKIQELIDDEKEFNENHIYTDLYYHSSW